MPLISRIVVPVDFSSRCLAMMPYVKRLATHYQARVELIHVIMPYHMIYGTAISEPVVFPTSRLYVEDQQKLMAGFAADELKGLPVQRNVFEGDTVDLVVNSAREPGTLVAMPTRGAGALRRFLLGSVAAKLLHDLPCPVLTGAHLSEAPVSPSVSIANILCAVNLGPESRATLAWAAQLAKDFRARLTVLHVIAADMQGMGVPGSPEQRLELENMVLGNLKHLQREVGAEPAHLHVQSGDPATAISAYAKSVDADLVVIGRGPQDNEQGRLAATAYAIIRESMCPVISI